MDQPDLIVKMVFGSHLYGTTTPGSDQDYKGIFMPSEEQIFLGRIPKSVSYNTKKGNRKRNDSKDVDTEIYSLHYFMQLACEGQTVALDMLHAPKDMIITGSAVWDWIVFHREQFYTKSLKAFIGYARRQAAKYGIKGSRLNAAEKVIELLKTKDPNSRLISVWNELPDGEHLHFIPLTVGKPREYQVCGKIFQETAHINYVLPILQKFYNEYGKRAQLAALNQGIDWKAISHALRAAYQIKELLVSKTITFPLPEAAIIIQVKQGELDYTTQVVPMLESLMDEVEELAQKSDLPEKVNRQYWDDILLAMVRVHLF